MGTNISALGLLLSVITASVKTVGIVERLPGADVEQKTEGVQE
jgi:hypothetical protein